MTYKELVEASMGLHEESWDSILWINWPEEFLLDEEVEEEEGILSLCEHYGVAVDLDTQFKIYTDKYVYLLSSSPDFGEVVVAVERIPEKTVYYSVISNLSKLTLEEIDVVNTIVLVRLLGDTSAVSTMSRKRIFEEDQEVPLLEKEVPPMKLTFNSRQELGRKLLEYRLRYGKAGEEPVVYLDSNQWNSLAPLSSNTNEMNYFGCILRLEDDFIGS